MTALAQGPSSNASFGHCVAEYLELFHNLEQKQYRNPTRSAKEDALPAGFGLMPTTGGENPGLERGWTEPRGMIRSEIGMNRGETHTIRDDVALDPHLLGPVLV
jgi:hypothetical protein